MPVLRTAEQAKQWLKARKVTVSDFAQTHGLPRHAVYKVLEGKHLGTRGAAHKAAVALGMKADDAAVHHPPFG